ncbi:MAG: alpha/beta fold hydrolase [Flavobacteriales bacterium]
MKDQLVKEGEFTYLEKGEGPVLLLLHGLFGALSNFNDVIDHFSNRYKVVIPMLPLYEMPILTTGVSSLAKFVERFVEHKKFDKVMLLGNSLGGHVSLVYSLKHPEKVDKMILTGSSGLYENAFGGSFPRRGDKEYLRQKIALTFYDPTMVTDQLVDECHEAVTNRDKVIRILALAKSAIRHNMAKELGNYKMPVCLIWGKNDTITPPEVAEEFNTKIENSTLFWIDKCGHAPMMEHPKEFNQILENWLNTFHS